MKAVHLFLHGRVQGVGYRDALRAQCEALDIAGWVRNRRDGSVEAVLVGEADAVDAGTAWARRGPPLALVSECFERSASEAETTDARRPFVRLPTV